MERRTAVGPDRRHSPRPADSTPARPVPPRRVPALRPGQMVSSGASLQRSDVLAARRRDGRPIWRNPARIAAEEGTASASKETAEALLGAIASELGVARDHVTPASKDPAEWLVKEANLPANVSPENSELKDPRSGTNRCAFSRAGSRPSGYVLPVQRWQAQAGDWPGAARKSKPGAARSISSQATAPSATVCRCGALPYVPPSAFPCCRRSPIRPDRAALRFSRHAGARPAGRLVRRGGDGSAARRAAPRRY